MQQIYISRNRLDAIRFRNSLAQRGIEAEIREPTDTASEAAAEAGPIGPTVWVADEQATAAGELVGVFHSVFDQAADEHGDVDDEASSSRPIDEASPRHFLVTWLTGVFCVACLVASEGLMREIH